MTRKLHGSCISFGTGLMAVVMCLFTAATSQATQYYWNAPNGGAGSWDTTTTIWSLDNLTNTNSWNNSAGDDAILNGFYTTTSTIAVDAGGISVHNITNNDAASGTVRASYNLTGGTLTLVGDSPTIDTPGWLAINSVIAGTSGLIKTGTSYLDTYGANTYSGTTVLKAGLTSGQNDLAFGTSTVMIESGATMRTWAQTRTYNNDFIASGTGFDGLGAMQLRMSGSWTLNGNVTLNSGYLRCSSSGYTMTFNGSTTLNTSSSIVAAYGSMIFNGSTTVNNGLITSLSTGADITFNGATSLNGTISLVDHTGTLAINGPVTLTGDSTISAGRSTGSWGPQLNVNNSIDGSAVNANLTIGAAGNTTRVHPVTGNITLGTGPLTKNYAGILQLTGSANSWGKLNITEGDLQIGDGGANGSLPADKDISITCTSYPTNWNGRLVFNSTKDFTISGSISGSAATTNLGGNTGGILVTNVGTLTLSGTNTAFQSPIAINGGKLRLGNNNALGYATSVTVGGGTYTSQLELGTENLIISNTITLAGRSAATAPHIQNVNGGTNSLTGDLSLVVGGNQYIVQSDSGKLTLNTVTNNATLASDRYLTLQGAGNGEVSGAMANGTASNLNSLHVIKAGSGTWTLSGSNTYTGSTTINAGKLVIGATGYVGASSLIDVKSGATLDVSSVSGFSLLNGQTLGGSGAVLGNVTLTGNAQLLPGTNGTVGLLSFQNNLTLGSPTGGTVKFDLASDTDTANNDLITLTSSSGILALPSGSDKATFTVNMLSTSLSTSSAYKLFTYQGTSSGNIANVLLSGIGGTTRQTGTLSINTGAKEIDLTVSGLPPTSLLWKGNAGSNWDFSTTNWTWVSNGSADRFYDIDTVTFDNSSSTQTVNLANTISPTTVTVNSNLDYTFQGTGAIAGGTAMTLTKSGTGKLTIKNTGTNTYGGTTTINAGTLQVGDNTSGGGLGGTGNVVNNGALIYYRTDDSAISGSLSGSGSLEKKGAGKLTLSNTNTAFTGATTISNGQVVMGSATAIGPTATSTVPVTITNSGSLDIVGNTLGTRPVTVQGAGDGTGAIVNSGSTNMNAFRYVTLTGDTTFGGTNGRWDIRTDNPTTTTAWLVGNGYKLTKTGSNWVYFVGLGDTGLSDIAVNGGVLGFQSTTTMGDPNKTITIASGAAMRFWDTTTNVLSKNLVMADGAGISNGSGANTFAGSGTLNGIATVTTDSGSLTLSGTLGGTGSLTKAGSAGSLILTSTANTWSGGTTINAGTLQIGTGIANGSLPDSGTIINNGALVFNSSNNFTFSTAKITGSGGLTKNGSGTVTLAAANSFSGAVTIQGNGALRLKNADALGDSLLSSTALSISGGTETSRLEFDDGGGGGYTLTAQPTITLLGRQPSIATPAHVNNYGNNTFNGSFNFATSGSVYTLQSDSGTLTLNYAITDTLTTARYLVLKGAGNGVIAGGITFSGSTGSLGVIKDGSGIWTISGSSTHNGSTVINAGTLALAGYGSIGSSPLINVLSGATFDVSALSDGYYKLVSGQTLSGSGTVKGDVTDEGGATIAPGSSIGTLTFNGNLTLAGGSTGDTIDYEFGGSSGDLLDVKGNLTLLGATDQETIINPILLGSLTTSSFRVASVTGTLTGTGIKVVNPTRYTITSSVTTGATGKIDLKVSGSNASLIWTGTASPNDAWDVKTTNNWLNDSSADIFYQADAVTFNDTATNTTVTMNTTVRPLSVTVDAGKDYTFTGSGKISGATGLTKTGTGTLTISNSSGNDYTGDTAISNGVLRLGASAAVQAYTTSNKFIINGGTLDLNGIDLHNTNDNLISPNVLVSGSGYNGQGVIVNNGSADRFSSIHYLTLNGDATIGGSRRFDLGRTVGSTMTGNGYTLTKVGSNLIGIINMGETGLGSVVINEGGLFFQGTTVVGTSSSLAPITVNSGGQVSLWARGTHWLII